ncbi:MAG: SGNH/GDSL hydrolase family protein [Marmoricola sp.]
MGPFRRYVALGDSQTEGLDDRYPDGTPRGWADRLAESLEATTSPDLQYANLAVRGCRARHVRVQQLPAALAMEPDLATVAVGMNDVLRHDFDLESCVRDVEETVAALRATGCTVLTMSFPDIALMLPLMSWLRPREVALDRRLRAIAAQYDVPLLDLFPLSMCGDPALWSHDRIHGSSEGHRRIAAGMAALAGVPGIDPGWSSPRPGHSGAGTVRSVARDLWWATTFMAPWLWRQVAHRDRPPDVAKRPALEVVTGSPATT